MFTGIIETLASLQKIKKIGNNLHLTLCCSFTQELKINQSLSHNGVCLTVVSIENNSYTVTVVEETIQKTNIALWKEGDKINLERAMKASDRLDGHLVQGHVDQTGICTNIQNKNGSWIFSFEYDNLENITIKKGSITINGTSLTVINSYKNSFSVAIIPYTYKHTVFHLFKKGSVVNLEFDIIGKYITRFQKHYNCK